MKKKSVLGLQPSVIKWARESIGISVEDLARKIKKPTQEILEWESGISSPSYAQLEKLSYKVFKRPLAIFFLPTPPEEISPDREFRTLPSNELLTLEPDTHFQIRRAHAHQLTLKDLFNGKNPSQKHIWKEISLNSQKQINQQAITIRQSLGVSLENQIEWKSDELALKYWRESAEKLGVFVFKAPFKQKEISGFCLYDPEFPLIYLNNSTTKTRQIFSLLHELAHLLFNINGISKFDNPHIDLLPQNEYKIEKFCNQVASEILIPSNDFAVQIKDLPQNIESVPDDVFVRLANRYGVSREAILRRLLDLNKVGSEFYEEKSKFWTSQKKKSSGGDWYASQNTYLSYRFAREVISQHYRNQITVDQASDFLGIKAKNFIGLEQRILEGAAA